jgi:hypothetical protein
VYCRDRTADQVAREIEFNLDLAVRMDVLGDVFLAMAAFAASAYAAACLAALRSPVGASIK